MEFTLQDERGKWNGKGLGDIYEYQLQYKPRIKFKQKGIYTFSLEQNMRDEVLAAVQQLKPIAANLDLTMSQLALAWALANPNVSSVIMGASKPSQVKENVKASGVKLSPQVLAEIDKALGSIPETSPERTESPNPRA
jgi:aryl-alcohol dehydrogenase-like predicted oxidoreductase